MIYDYYIFTYLHIYLNDDDNEYVEVKLHRDRGNYYVNIENDSEEDDYDEVEHTKGLIPTIRRAIIYNSNSFKNVDFEKKYKTFVENEINKYDKKLFEIAKIVKVDVSYETQKCIM